MVLRARKTCHSLLQRWQESSRTTKRASLMLQWQQHRQFHGSHACERQCAAPIICTRALRLPLPRPDLSSGLSTRSFRRWSDARFLSNLSTTLKVERSSTGAKDTNPSKGGLSTLSMEVRQALRAVPHPVAIVTSGPVTLGQATEDADVKKGLRGLLVSSFNTITLTPEPYVSFNLKVPSTTWDAIQETNEFKVHMMWTNKLAEEFAANKAVASVGDAMVPKDTETLLNELMEQRLFGLVCELRSYFVVEDHVLIVGKVIQLLPSDTPKTTSKGEQNALLWTRGAWHVAEPMVRASSESEMPPQSIESSRTPSQTLD